MLSIIGRAATRRVGAGASHLSTNRVLQSTRHLQYVDASNHIDNGLSFRQSTFSLRRLFATATKAAARTKAETATIKSSTKKASKKTVKKPVKKAKKAVIKPKPKAKPKKILSPEQKGKLEIKKLKELALSPPKGKPSTPWLVLMKEYSVENASPGKSAVSFAKEAAAKYKSLSPGEIEEYNHKANQNKTENSKAFKKWIESHTPEQIRIANNARVLLKKRTGKSYGPALSDERLPKRGRSDFILFTQERWASGDLKGVKLSDASTLLRKEFLALPETERKVFKDRANADGQRYIQEYKTVFHRDSKATQKHAAV